MDNSIVYGLDEVGRGAIAGPLVAAAVSLPARKSSLIRTIELNSNTQIRDSKKLSKSQRFKIFNTVLSINIPIFIAYISAREINQKGIGWANKQIFINLIQEILTCHSELACHIPTGIVDSESTKNNIDSGSVAGMTNIHFTIDGNLKLAHSSAHITCLPKADSLFPEVSLASIVAKVARDSYMQDLHANFPGYGFSTNMGYGTQTHINALQTFGPSPHHRIQFVQTALKNSISNSNL